MIGGSTIAKRYARALFALGAETGEPEALLDEIDELTEAATEMPALSRVLFTPLFPRGERRAVAAEVARRLDHSGETRAFAMFLVDENRMSLLPAIRDELRTLVEEAAGRVSARVVSARPLAQREIDALRQALSQRMNAVVSVEAEVDPSLIGGVIASVGDLRFDGSLRTQLDSLRGSLRRGSE